jgi:hypothetical protein
MASISWKKGISGNWTTATDWSTGTVPGATDTAHLSATGTYTVTSSANVTIDILTTVKNATLDIAAGDFDVLAGTGAGANAGKIEVADGASFEVGGTFDNTGTIGLNSTGDATTLVINKSVTLAGTGAHVGVGGGNIVLSDNSSNAIVGDTVNGGTLTIDGNLISGAGQIGRNGDGTLTLHVSSGGIFATGTSPLTIDTGNTVINSGEIGALNGGDLEIDDSINNTGGEVGVRFGGALGIGTFRLASNIKGGTVYNDGGLMGIDIGDMNDVEVATNAFSITSITASTIEGNAAQYTLAATGFQSVVTLTGESLNLTEPSSNAPLVSGGTFTGGEVYAEQGAQIDISSEDLKGVTFKAVVGTPGTFGNYGGGGINLTDCLVQGGTLTTSGNNAGPITDGSQAGGIFVDQTVFDGTTSKVVTSAQLAVGSMLEIKGTIDNSGIIFVESAPFVPLPIILPGFLTGPFPCTLFVDGAASLTGHGTIKLESYGTYAGIAGDAVDGGTLSNNGNTIVGLGLIGTNGDGTLSLLNLAGTIDAAGDPNSITNALTIDTGNMVINTALMEATKGGVLAIADTVTNSGETASGDIDAVGEGSIIDLIGGSIDGGAATIGAGALLEATGGASSPSTLEGVTVTDKGTLEATDSTTLTLQGTTVNASGGVVEAVDAGVGGTTGTPPPSAILLDNATINDGTLTTLVGGIIETVAGSTGTLNGVTISNSSAVTVVDGSTLTLKGIITNDGTVALNSTGDATTLAIGDYVTLTGGGMVTLSDVAATSSTTSSSVAGIAAGVVIGGSSATNQIIASGTTAANPFTLTNSNDTITGAGAIGEGDRTLTLDNQTHGAIDATGANPLTINTGNHVTNAGIVEATNPNGLAQTGGLVIDDAVDSSGTVIADGGNVTIKGALTGGGHVELFSGNMVTLGSSSTNGITFETGGSASLVLQRAQGLSGSVTGLAPTDTIDLTNFALATTTISKITNTNHGAINSITDVTLTDSASHLSEIFKLVNTTANEFGTSAADYSLTADHGTGTLFQIVGIVAG